MRVIALAAAVLFYVAAVTSEVVDDKPEPYQSITVPGMKRYEYFSTAQNWSSAHQVCTSNGGHLAMPTSEEEAVVLLDLMASNGINQIHAGFQDFFEEGNFITLSGVSLSRSGYKSWAFGTPPSNDPAINCGSLIRWTTSGLSPTSCSTPLQHVCEYKLWDDYELIPGFGYYKLHRETTSWYTAWKTCRDEGSYLMYFNSVAERDAVLEKYPPNFIGNFYLRYGAHHFFANHNFLTIEDEPLNESGFSIWSPGYPANYNNDWYPVLTLSLNYGQEGTLQTDNTNVARPFMCKHALHDIN